MEMQFFLHFYPLRQSIGESKKKKSLKAFLGVAPSSARTKSVAPLTGQTVELGFLSFSGLFFHLSLYQWLGVNVEWILIPCVSSVLPFSSQDNREPPDCCLSESFTSPACTLGVDLRRGRRRFSGNLQLPPLSWRQGERSRTPDNEVMARPTSLPFGAPPRIDITPVDPEWWVDSGYKARESKQAQCKLKKATVMTQSTMMQTVQLPAVTCDPPPKPTGDAVDICMHKQVGQHCVAGHWLFCSFCIYICTFQQ